MSDLPLCIDLDGTLIRTDTLNESIWMMARHSPLKVLLLPIWLLRGRGFLKRKVMTSYRPSAASLSYNQELLEYIKREHARGRKLVLATASDQVMADDVAKHLGIFDLAIGSDGRINKKSHQKLKALEALFGKKGFVYAGNSWSDVPVWLGSAAAITVDVSPSILAAIKEIPLELKISR